ncbi:MAG: response regulator [Bacteroidota bacterium]
MGLLQAGYQSIVRRGIDLSLDAMRSVSKITNTVLLYILVGGLATFCISWKTQMFLLSIKLVTLGLFALSFFLIYLRKFGLLDVVRFSALGGLNIALYIVCIFFEDRGGLQNGFYIFALLPFLIFSHAEVIKRAISITFAVMMYGFVLFNIFPFVPESMGTPQDVFLFNTLLNVFVFISLVAIIQHYYESKQMNTNRIKADQYILKEAQGIANLGNWSWDPSSNYWEWSNAVFDILGLEHDINLTIGDFYGLIHPVDRLKVQNTLRNVIEETEQVRLEFKIFTAEQEERDLSMIFKPITNERGKLICVRGIMQDISIQKEIEENLIKAKDAAEAATRAKSEFLSTMSHEIRTPLNAVIGMAGLLAETHLNDTQEDYLNTIKIGGNNLLSVINDILDYSKIESGNMELEFIDFNFSDPIDNALDLLGSKAREKGLELLAMFGSDIPTFIKGDIVRIQQILVNLINNAIKFTEKGEILVRVESKGKWEEGHILQFSVKDTGVGIPENKIHRLFRSFSQVDASTNRKYGGSGLGLAICKRLVELMQGEIWVESVEGEGTEFFFNIRTYTSEKKEEKKDGLPTNNKGARQIEILLVDDNTTNLRILETHCRALGVHPISCTSAEEAWEHLETAHEVKLVITDLHMPGMNGIDLAVKSRNELKEQGPPFILLSSVAQLPPEAKNGLFKALLTKPCRKTQLEKVIKECLSNKAPERKEKTREKSDILLDLARPIEILIAEDNSINQKVIRKIMGKLGLNADIAANGLEVLQAIREKSYDLILMDMQMPEMDGLQATREVRKIDSSVLAQQPLIIALTANAMESEKRDCFDAGMDDFLAKPVRWELLAQTLEKWFGKDAKLLTMSKQE